jgi:hypothetical protein
MMLVITMSKEASGKGRTVIEPTRKSAAKPFSAALLRAVAIILAETSMPYTAQPGWRSATCSVINPVPLALECHCGYLSPESNRVSEAQSPY